MHPCWMCVEEAAPPMRITLLLLTLALTAPAHAASIVLSSGKDNTLYESTDGSLSNGAGNHLFAGTNGFSGGFRVMRSVLAFDLSPIPDNARVDSVQLLLDVNTPMGNAGTVQVHRATQDWGEGSSVADMGEGGGAASSAGDASWIHTFFDGSLWTTPGGDFDAAFSDSLDISGNGTASFDSGQLAADVQAWLDDPATNFGWLLKRSDESGAPLRFGSFDNSSAPPRLAVDYTLIPEPQTALLLGLGLGLLGAARSRG